MSGDERARHELHERLVDLLGPDHASLLMSTLPPRPWTELVTRDDLRATSAELRGEMAALRGELRAEMAALEQRLTAAMRMQLFAMIGALATMQALTVAVLS